MPGQIVSILISNGSALHRTDAGAAAPDDGAPTRSTADPPALPGNAGGPEPTDRPGNGRGRGRPADAAGSAAEVSAGQRRSSRWRAAA